MDIFFELERHLLMEQCTPASRRQPGVPKWPIWVIVGLNYFDTPSGKVLGVSRSGMINLAGTFYHFYLEIFWIFF